MHHNKMVHFNCLRIIFIALTENLWRSEATQSAGCGFGEDAVK